MRRLYGPFIGLYRAAALNSRRSAMRVQGRAGMLLAFIPGLVVASAGTATAAKLLTGKDIKNGSIARKDLSTGVRAELSETAKPGAQGPAGPGGPAGPQGPQGLQGVKGDTGAPPAVEAPRIATLLNGFAVYDQLADGTGDRPVRFWKDPFGVVHLEGAVEFESSPGMFTPPPDFTTIFTIPAGYRPAGVYASFPVLTAGHSGSAEQLGYLQIDSSSGDVDYVGGNVGYFALDGVTFL